jgi:RimJ/RimL family protein N-acetyltransferase
MAEVLVGADPPSFDDWAHPERILDLEGVSPNNGQRCVLRAAAMSDAARLLAWRNDGATRAASHQTGLVDAVEHVAWMERALSNPDRLLLLLWAERGDDDDGDCSDDERLRPVGTVRLDRDRAKNEVEFSWTVDPAMFGKGYASHMVTLAAQHAPPGTTWRAEVKVGNVASARLAQRLFMVLEETRDQVEYWVRRPQDSGDE